MAKKDISGQKFGRLTAVRPLYSPKGKGVIWLCQCDCGGKKEVSVSQLTREITRSCGCLPKENKRRKDINGQRFGRLVAKKFCYYNERHIDCWLFECDCGTQKIIPAASVKWGNTRSCGCLYKEHATGLRKQDIAGKRFSKLVVQKV